MDFAVTGPDVPTGRGGRDLVKVAVVGAGLVGSSFAYALVLAGLASDVVLIDIDERRARGEALDIGHGQPFVRPATVRAGTYPDCRGARCVVVAAGVAQKTGESRLELLRRNAVVFKDVIPRIAENAPDTVILVATNPVDVMTHAAYRYSGFPPERVIGSGTLLDSSRMRYLLSRHCGIDPRSVHAYVLGEHGDSEVVAWSLTNVAGMSFEEFCPMCGRGCESGFKEEIAEDVRTAAYRIISLKGATHYAIGLALREIGESIIRNENRVLTVSSYVSDYLGVSGVCLSVPCVVGAGGIARRLTVRLTPDEVQVFRKSAAVIDEAARSVGLS